MPGRGSYDVLLLVLIYSSTTTAVVISCLHILMAQGIFPPFLLILSFKLIIS